jgi:hypothetical protein
MQAVLEPSLEIDFEPFQSGFAESKARFPAFVAGWGTGKTMCAIAKGLVLSVEYPNNLGLIARKKFTDLRDSTMKDFKRYTGLHIPQTTKEVTIPDTNSTIMFRHAEELSGLQNVNLGWFYLEQAEEFETDEQFQLLRGRLRREDCQRQGMIIANAAGHNWIWRIWKKNQGSDPDYELYEAVTFDNLHNLPDDFLKDLAKMEIEAPKKYKRFVQNSWDDYDLEGAYYGEVMNWLRNQKRIRKMSLDKSSPVYTVWDPGYTTAIWFFQMQGMDVVFLRCYEDTASIEEYVEVLNQFKRDYGYKYGGHYAPFDVDSNANKIIAGTSLLEKAREHNLNFFQLKPEHRKIEGIERTRQFLHKCWFDSEDCEIGIEALDRYREKKVERLSTEQHPVYMEGVPADGWEKHLCDAMRYASMAVNKIGESDGLTLDQIEQMQIEAGLK